MLKAPYRKFLTRTLALLIFAVLALGTSSALEAQGVSLHRDPFSPVTTTPPMPRMASPGAAGWVKTYGNATGHELALSLASTSDGGYVLAGHSILQNSVEGRVWKVDAAGYLVWQKQYTGSDQEPLPWIASTPDGGYIAAGNTNFGAGDTDAWVLKLDAAGNIVWQKALGGADSDGTISAVPAQDGGFIVTGFTEILSQGQSENWILKLDAQGNLLWQKVYGERSSNPALRSIIPTVDGGYLIAGVTPTLATGDGWLLKLDRDGNVLWQKAYGGSSYDMFSSVVQTADGGYLAGGYTTSFGAGDHDAWLVRVDRTGNVVWQKTYGGSELDLVNGLDKTRDGGFVFTGITRSFGSGGTDAWVAKVDASGNPIWQTVYGGTGEDWLYAIRALSDGSSIAVGSTDSFGTGNGDAWVLNVNADGQVAANCSLGASFTTGSPDSNATVQATLLDAAPGVLG